MKISTPLHLHLHLLLLLPSITLAFTPVTTTTTTSSSRQWMKDSTLRPTKQNLSMTADVTNLVNVASQFQLLLSDETVSAAASSTYSKASYYTTLGVYIMSFPGLWSQVKRSTKAKTKRKTYVTPGENAAVASESKKDLRQTAGEIMAYMKANNYEVAQAGETITFRGIVEASKSQAFFLTFCTALGLASLALVLQIQFIDLKLPLGLNWFYLVLLSPYAGIYYWRSGDRVDDIQVKLSTNDEETENKIVVEGNDEEIDRMWRALNWAEKGMVRVEGAFE